MLQVLLCVNVLKQLGAQVLTSRSRALVSTHTFGQDREFPGRWPSRGS
jgi:hypothetical protein